MDARILTAATPLAFLAGLWLSGAAHAESSIRLDPDKRIVSADCPDYSYFADVAFDVGVEKIKDRYEYSYTLHPKTVDGAKIFLLSIYAPPGTKVLGWPQGWHSCLQNGTTVSCFAGAKGLQSGPVVGLKISSQHTPGMVRYRVESSDPGNSPRLSEMTQSVIAAASLQGQQREDEVSEQIQEVIAADCPASRVQYSARTMNGAVLGPAVARSINASESSAGVDSTTGTIAITPEQPLRDQIDSASIVVTDATGNPVKLVGVRPNVTKAPGGGTDLLLDVGTRLDSLPCNVHALFIDGKLSNSESWRSAVTLPEMACERAEPTRFQIELPQ